jgi:hypothetical protein
MKIDIKKIQEKFITENNSISIACNCMSYLLNMYLAKQEKSIVKAQNEVALSQYLPTNNTLLLKDKRVKVKYLTPDTWTDAFKLIKLLWQTRQLV